MTQSGQIGTQGVVTTASSNQRAELGTPLDYTSDLYRVYFEVRDPERIALSVIEDFLGPGRAARIVSLAHGYELELPIQCVPEIVQQLSARNIAIYQLVRYAKVTGSWATAA